MSTSKYLKNSSLTVWSLLFSIVAFLGTGALGAIAESNSAIDTLVLFQPPPEEEQPEDSEGAASRQNPKCDQDVFIARSEIGGNKPAKDTDTPTPNGMATLPVNLTAIVPRGNSGLTTAKRPTFWVYLPQTSARQAILAIKEGNNPHWQQSINLTEKAGIMGIEMPQHAPALELGKNYQWAVILVCGDQPNPNDPVVTAGIKRIDRSQIRGKQSIATAGLGKAALYASQGIWYDALDILIAEKPFFDNWDDIWARYLQSGGLNKIANKPIIGQ